MTSIRRLSGLYLIVCALLFAAHLAFAQVDLGPLTGAGRVAGGGPPPSYTGPGDIVSGSFQWWGFRAYTAAYATAGGKIANICLTSNLSCTDMVSGSNGQMVITTVGGSACGIVTCYVHTLYDQSGALNCTSTPCDMMQGTSGAQPIFVPNCVNSQPCMTIAASASTIGLTAASNGTVTSTGFTITHFGQIAGAADSSGNLVAVYCGPGLYYPVSSSSMRLTASFPTGITATISTAAFHTYVGLGDTTSSALYVDGTPTSGTVTQTDSCFGQTTNIGFNGTSSPLQYWNEGGIWASVFNSTQATNMSSNISSFW